MRAGRGREYASGCARTRNGRTFVRPHVVRVVRACARAYVRVRPSRLSPAFAWRSPRSCAWACPRPPPPPSRQAPPPPRSPHSPRAPARPSAPGAPQRKRRQMPPSLERRAKSSRRTAVAKKGRQT
eukprot:6201102-Pleurochrysis_carterae.AAC.4